jgi:hypothetical protein
VNENLILAADRVRLLVKEREFEGKAADSLVNESLRYLLPE